MKAAYLVSYGQAGSLQYGEMPEPVLRKNSLLVQVEAVSVNPADWKFRQGVLNITKAFSNGELGEAHNQEMLSASKFTNSIVALVIIYTLLELVFWHKCHQLRKDCFTYMHFRSNKEKSENIISNRKIFKPLYHAVY